MANSRRITIPFAQGQDEDTAPKELPLGLLKEAVNVRQAQGSAFQVRPDFSNLAMTTFHGGTLVPSDLVNLNGRLFCLGDAQSQSVDTDLFELVSQPAGAWHGTIPPGTNANTRIPALTKVREIGKSPDGVSAVKTARVAALNGLVCMAFGFGGTAGGLRSYVHIFRASDDATLVFQSVLLSNPRVVAVGNSFWVVGVDSSNDLAGFRFDTTVDNDLQSVVTLYTGTVTTNIFDLNEVNNTTVAQFVAFIRDGSTTTVRRFNESGTQVASITGPAVAPDTLAVEADASANQVIIAYRVGAADCNVQTYNLTTGASIIGPTAFYGQTVTGDISLVRPSLGSTTCFISVEDSDLVVRTTIFTATTHSRGTEVAYNYELAGRGCAFDVVGTTSLGVVQPMITGNSNQLAHLGFASNEKENIPLVQLDNGIAINGDPGVAAAMGGQVCRDRSTGLFYWARLIEGTDGQAIPVVAEFSRGDRQRRQMAQIGNSLLISGGMPLSFDAQQVSESGFLEKPVFKSSVSVSNGGSLIVGAEYDYVAVYKWTDAQNRQALSQVSDIETVTIAPTHTGTVHEIYTPHTLRQDVSKGSTPTVSLYRTFANADKTAATLLGRNGVSPPSSSLNGLQLFVFVADGTSTLFTITFDAGSIDADAIAADINAVTTGRVLATNVGGAIQLETVATGDNIELWMYGGTAASILGFILNEHSEGTTTFTKGTVFQLCASAPVSLNSGPGEPITINDFLSDANLLTREALYTQGEKGGLTGILENDPPPPFEFCWTVGDRVVLGGLPDRSEVRISKALSPAEALAFSDDFSFSAVVDGDVTAVAALDGVPIAFTEDSIYRLSPAFPNDIGESSLGAGQNSFNSPDRLPSEGGCINAFSIVETSLGLFYQSRDFKIMLLPRGGGAPIWVGKKIQETLQLFPTITAAVYCDADNTVCFTCKDGSNVTKILVFDIVLMQWYVDTFPVAQNIRAACELNGKLVYVNSTTTVKIQTDSAPAAFIPMNAMTGSVKAFGGNGWGQIPCVTLFGEWRGNCKIRARFSYDDGVTFVNGKTFTLNASTGFVTPGKTITLQWYPARRKTNTFVIDFQCLEDSGGTFGSIFNEWSLELIGAPVGKVRTTSTQRG